MSVNYKKLWKLMIDKNLSKTELTHLAGISTNAMAKLGRNEDVRVNVLEKLCTSLDCKLDDIVEFETEQKEASRRCFESIPKVCKASGIVFCQLR